MANLCGRVVGGDAVERKRKEIQKREMKRLIGQAFLGAGLPVSWGWAFAEVESGFNPDARNDTGGDKARGGAWGLFQMTYRTAKGLRYPGTPESLLDPLKNINMAIILLEQIRRTSPALIDVAARYNSGKVFADAPIMTQKDYVPRILAAEKRYADELRLTGALKKRPQVL